MGEAVSWEARGRAELGARWAPPSRPAALSSGSLRFLMGTIPSACGFHAAPDVDVSVYIRPQGGDSVGWGHTGWTLPGSFPPLPGGLRGTLGWGSASAMRCGQLGSWLEDGGCGLPPLLPTHLHWGGLHPPRGRGAWWSTAGASHFHQMELRDAIGGRGVPQVSLSPPWSPAAALCGSRQ